jgi:hypothetical protein
MVEVAVIVKVNVGVYVRVGVSLEEIRSDTVETIPNVP